MRIAVVGLGVIGMEHARLLCEIPGATLAGLFDVDGQRAADASRRFGAQAYGSLDELLADPAVDAVDVCTSDDHHRDAAVRALGAGKHLLLEKPVATTREDVLAILDAAQRHPELVAMVGQTLRFDPDYRAIRNMLARGELGTISHFYLRRDNSIINAERVRGRTTVTFFLGVHDLDFLMWALRSRVRTVTAFSPTVVNRTGVPDATLGVLEMEGGAVGGVEFSWVLPPRADVLDAQADFVGSEGALRLRRPEDEFVVARPESPDLLDVERTASAELPFGRDALKNEIWAFAMAVENREPSPVPVEEACYAVCAALALDAAVKSRGRVDVEYLA